jgi:CheY-like chemotaxis protein
LPVIAMTADAMVADRDRALAAGMNDHVAKPIRLDEFFGTLARWIRPARAPGSAAAPLDDAVLRSSGVEPGSALHARLQATFTDRCSSFPSRFQAASGDAGTAARLAHDLKCEAATFGASALCAAAAELEAASARRAPEQEVEARLQVVLQALAPVLRALRGP